MFFANGGTLHLPITQCIPHLHRSIIVVEASQLLQVKIMSVFRVPFSNHPSDPLPRLTTRRDVLSETQSAHLNPMGLRKCYPITVKPLTVRGYQKHPSTLPHFLLEKYSIQTRDIPQDIYNGHPSFNSSSVLC